MASDLGLLDLDDINATAGNLSAVLPTVIEWGDLLVGPFNDSESAEWQREYVRQYQQRHRNDPEVKYAVVIFYLIVVRAYQLQNFSMLPPTACNDPAIHPRLSRTRLNILGARNMTVSRTFANCSKQPVNVPYMKSWVVLQLTMVGSQSALVYWKKVHKRSYELVGTLPS